MPYDSRTYRILIASPSDVEQERKLAVDVIQKWNDAHSYNRQIVLLPVRWETHTAPEYGTRPQEVINRSIVDNCDLLLGIFWTRFGTPTGEADSGTLEEIQRAAKAGKPVMLYFSEMGTNPSTVDIKQLERLREFKKEISPDALIGSYDSYADFQDKLSRQLQITVGELQASDDSKQAPPLELVLLKNDLGNITIDDVAKHTAPLYSPKDLADLIAEQPEASRDGFRNALFNKIAKANSLPIRLGIRNVSSSGIRNVYVEMLITSEVDLEGVEQHFYNSDDAWASMYGLKNSLVQDGSPRSWKFVFDWDAIQPQRNRPVAPPLLIRAPQSTVITFTATVYADNFPEPVSLQKTLAIDVLPVECTVKDVVPNYESLRKQPGTVALYNWLQAK